MAFRRIDDVAIAGKRVLIRVDFNVPVEDGVVTNDAKIWASLSTIKHCISEGAAVILMSHLGRPKAGVVDEKYSLAPVAVRLSEILTTSVHFIRDWQNGLKPDAGRVYLIENLRFEHGETENDPKFSSRLAELCDVFVMDAFGTAHRAHSSTAGIGQFVDTVCAGFLMAEEMNALSKILQEPQHPLVAVIGGAKVSTKIDVLNRLSGLADMIIVGGGMANTFMLSDGYPVGNSLVEPDLVDTVRDIQSKVDVMPVVDVMTAPAMSGSESATLRLADEVGSDEMILDIGPETARRYAAKIEQAKMIVWNGPMGVFEHPQFGEATRLVATAISEAAGFSVAGGGDTLAAIEQYSVRDGIGYISTGGGAFLEFLEGSQLPGIKVLET